MPVSVGGFLVWALFPVILTTALLFPIYAPWRYRVIVADGERERLAMLRQRFVRLGVGVSLATYVMLAIGILRPGITPIFSRFIENGGLAGIVPLIFANVAMGAIFNRERALRTSKSPT